MRVLQADKSNITADTGSATHYAIADWHNKKDVQRAIREMRKAVGAFPLADFDAAETHFRRYSKDPRNIEAQIVLCEAQETVAIKAHKNDPTQSDIVITGKIDQVRCENGLYYVWDVKTGKSMDGFQMLHHYCLQLCAYQLMASRHYPIAGVGVIRTQDYLKRKPGPVFWSAPWGVSDATLLLNTVRLRVAEIRRGEVALSPDSPSCDYCPARTLSNCMPLYKEYHVKSLGVCSLPLAV